MAFLLFPVNSENAVDIYTRIADSFKDAKAISVSFAMPDLHVQGSLYAAGNSYRLVLPGRTVVSDGETVSNYFSARNQMVVSSVITLEHDITPQNVLLNFPRYMHPTLEKVHGATGPGEVWLRLRPKDKEIPVEEIRLQLDRATKSEIRAIVVDDGLQTRKWEIRSIEIHDTVDSSKFELDPPTGTRIIDMRP